MTESSVYAPRFHVEPHLLFSFGSLCQVRQPRFLLLHASFQFIVCSARSVRRQRKKANPWVATANKIDSSSPRNQSHPPQGNAPDAPFTTTTNLLLLRTPPTARGAQNSSLGIQAPSRTFVTGPAAGERSHRGLGSRGKAKVCVYAWYSSVESASARQSKALYKHTHTEIPAQA